jgi:hypothetical protein
VALGDASRRAAGWAEDGLALPPRAAQLGLTARRSAAARSALVSQADSWTSEVASAFLESRYGSPLKLGLCVYATGTGRFLVLVFGAPASFSLVRSSDERALLSNAELTGRQRCDAWAARRMMNHKSIAAQAARRWRSG